jgi:xanthine dehydrogenase/oxidase
LIIFVLQDIPGVVAFFAAKDIPGKNNFMPKLPMHEEIDEIFCSGETAHYGQPVGLIVADTFALASYAATKVKVTYKQSGNSIQIVQLMLLCKY